jgi:hypothetical protein
MNFSTTAAEVLHPVDVALFGAASPQQREALATAAVLAALFDRTPSETGSRVVAAHHEAGHVVVAKALGYSIDSVRVVFEPAFRSWTGYTAHHFPGEPERRVLIPAEKPHLAERIATLELAGFIAEGRITQPLHPKSSMDERFRAAITCAALDDAARCTVGTTLTRVMGRVATIIGRNIAALDKVVGLLMRMTQPNARQLAVALAGIQRCRDFARSARQGV